MSVVPTKYSGTNAETSFGGEELGTESLPFLVVFEQSATKGKSLQQEPSNLFPRHIKYPSMLPSLQYFSGKCWQHSCTGGPIQKISSSILFA